MKKRKNLIRERNKLNLTQKELAEEIGISEVMLRKLEAGDRNPSPDTAKKFAIFYKKELDYLFPDIFLVNFDTKHIKN